jgi:4-amino-4-deoxy-L-arabinose transferase-like glycosyltransferase
MRSFPILLIILIVYLVLGFLYARLTPAWQSPDEPAHYNYVGYLAGHGALPVLVPGCYDEAYLNALKSQKFPPEMPIDSICYENYQPPLYYALAAPIYRLSGGNLLTLRLFSVLLGLGSLIFVYKTIGLFLPEPVLALGTTAFVAFVPMHLTMLASVNNDSLAELLFIGLVYLLLNWLVGRPEDKPLPIMVGLVLGLILITKVTAYIAVPVVALVLWLGDRRLGSLLKNGIRAYLPALVIALPFYARNSFIYGGFDILGLTRHDQVVVGQLRTVDRLADVGFAAYLSDLLRTTFHSFWGQFGWLAVPMDSRVYLALFIVQMLAVVGLVLWLWHSPPQTKVVRQSLGIMAAILLLAAGVFIGLNLSFVQFQGRYFFTALMPLGLFFSLGLREAFQRRWTWGLAAVLLLLTIWIGLTSLLGTGLDKWGVLISGLALIGLLAWRWLPIERVSWVVAGVYAGLAGLAGISVWWFIIPNLS